MGIHPTALVAPTAELGADVSIGPYAIIEDHVYIGDGSVIDAHAVVREYTRMGARNHVHPHAVVGGVPQDLKFQGEESWLVIGDNNSIREFSTSHRGTNAGNGETRIGNNNLFMAYTHVAHDCILGNGIVMSNAASLAGHVIVGDNVIIAGMSGIHQFVRVGAHAFVGGMTGVAQDVPPWMLASGPRAVVHGPNLVGLRRAGAAHETVTALKGAFRLLWRSNLLRDEALAQIMEQYGSSPEIIQFVEFVRSSERGICSAEKITDSEKNES